MTAGDDDSLSLSSLCQAVADLTAGRAVPQQEGGGGAVGEVARQVAEGLLHTVSQTHT